MATYTVKAATVKREMPDAKYGPAVLYDLTLDAGDGEQVRAEWFTKATTPVPQFGDRLEGDVTDGQYGKSFKKAAGQFGGGGGGGPRPRDPQERRSIQAQVAVKAAVEIARLAHDSGRSTEQVMATVEANAKKLAGLIEGLSAS